MGARQYLLEPAALHVVERWIAPRWRGLIRFREDPLRAGGDRVANALHHQGALPAASSVFRKYAGHAEPRAVAVEKERRTPDDDVTIHCGVQMPARSPEQRRQNAREERRALCARDCAVGLADKRTVDGDDAQIGGRR